MGNNITVEKLPNYSNLSGNEFSLWRQLYLFNLFKYTLSKHVLLQKRPVNIYTEEQVKHRWAQAEQDDNNSMQR